MGKTNLVLGIDIGGTNTAFGLCDKKGNIVFEHKVSTSNFATPEDLVDAIYSIIQDTSFHDSIKGIGIGAPNGNHFTGTIDFAPNLKWEGRIPLAQLFSDRFNIKTTLTNDANAAAIGERVYGNAKDLCDFVTITLGTGLGSGVVAGGTLIYGHDGFAGEYGHIRVVPNGRDCKCGRKGCLETYVSATGVVRSINELESIHKDSSELLRITQPTSENVFNSANSGDIFANEIIDFTANTLGEALADFACFSSPKAYVLFGGIAQSGTPFAAKVKSAMENAILNIYKDKIEIRISSLHNQNAAILGAASLMWNK